MWLFTSISEVIVWKVLLVFTLVLFDDNKICLYEILMCDIITEQKRGKNRRNELKYFFHITIHPSIINSQYL